MPFKSSFVSFDALRPIQPFFSPVGMTSFLPGLNYLLSIHMQWIKRLNQGHNTVTLPAVSLEHHAQSLQPVHDIVVPIA